MGKNSRLETWLQYRVRVTISDTRYFVGTFLSYDRHMNIVLVDAEEFRKVKNPENSFKEIKRVVGLILIRGDNIVSFTAERAPVNKKSMSNVVNKGIATGRGVPLNNYVPMQGNFNANITNQISNMPTGMVLGAGTSKSLTPASNPNFRSTNISVNSQRQMMPMNAQMNPNSGSANNAPQRGLPQIPAQLPFPPNSKSPTE
ncbi:small nuclear ribonucleoprotein-associated protein B, putative [Plasmodium ovale wallikeri]|uniref:Sm protein B n=2 Tax=Plasmodium ovale TaxID=36330 RepID=A0A1A8ZPL5_PLAOA|nr:small nuclear ribonucleoprotein-associated protein B, putative [Plasmodium ovale wallikeri]SBT46491.1 small nuclear ribonucleoprotein-associated protein B, putative [Plasmodium ovale wallikeri]SBT78918.1 small nuclear ribonucleoprotein-associated protein B, putative [Plasmodium ovale]